MTETFAQVLRRLRQDRKISQTRLAELAGVDHSYVSRLEAGTRTPAREMVDQLADALETIEAERQELHEAGGFLYAFAAKIPPPVPPYGYVVTPDPEGGYFVFYPDCPGCMTQGEDALEVAYMARDALETWVEDMRDRGQPLPPVSHGEALVGTASTWWARVERRMSEEQTA